MPIRSQVLPSFYQDSVVLMRVAAQVKKEPGVREVAALMGTDTNKTLLVQSGLETQEGMAATPEDLIVTVDADTEDQTTVALAQVKSLLTERRSAGSKNAELNPHTLDSALRLLPNANLAVISVPGEFVRFEALRALRRGLNVFLFSDNVPIEDEVELKKESISRGLLCMGPDCGTAYLNGVGLGFYNVTKRGRIGFVAASGTGLQAVVSRLTYLGEGVSQAIGVGGRDVSAEVGGMMTLFALQILAADPETEAIVLISKPPHRDVLSSLRDTLAEIDKPVVACCLGGDQLFGEETVSVRTLGEAADAVTAHLRNEPWYSAAFREPGMAKDRLSAVGSKKGLVGSSVLGLFTGGTLAHEARLLLEESLGKVSFNGNPTVWDNTHRVIDLGDDAYTVGRPHPMIAPETRTELIRNLSVNSGVGVLVLDLVLGMGAHADPARPVVEALGEVEAAYAVDGRSLVAVASVVGTPDDPQNLTHQIHQLTEAGVLVFPTNAEAARFAAMIVQPDLCKDSI